VFEVIIIDNAKTFGFFRE